MTYTRNPEAREKRRASIVHAAVQLMLERGPNVDLEQVTRAADIGKGTLYNYFEDKDDLIRAVRVDLLLMPATTNRNVLLLEIDLLDRGAFIQQYKGSPMLEEYRRAIDLEGRHAP